jgi:hypothetical protein
MEGNETSIIRCLWAGFKHARLLHQVTAGHNQYCTYKGSVLNNIVWNWTSRGHKYVLLGFAWSLDCCSFRRVKLYLWTAATNGPIVHKQVTHEYGKPRCNDTDWRNPKISDKCPPQCHFVHHISHTGVTWAQTRASAVRFWLLSTWDMARLKLRLIRRTLEQLKED